MDFGLLDREGKLLENPIHYRDSRTQGMIEKSFEYLPKERFYETTGLQFMELNTVFQLLALKENRPEVLERADKLLLTPDLFAYFLTGVKSTEYSIASTTQLLDAKNVSGLRKLWRRWESRNIFYRYCTLRHSDRTAFR